MFWADSLVMNAVFGVQAVLFIRQWSMLTVLIWLEAGSQFSMLAPNPSDFSFTSRSRLNSTRAMQDQVLVSLHLLHLLFFNFCKLHLSFKLVKIVYHFNFLPLYKALNLLKFVLYMLEIML